jgi:hypothetical protein
MTVRGSKWMSHGTPRPAGQRLVTGAAGVIIAASALLLSSCGASGGNVGSGVPTGTPSLSARPTATPSATEPPVSTTRAGIPVPSRSAASPPATTPATSTTKPTSTTPKPTSTTSKPTTTTKPTTTAVPAPAPAPKPTPTPAQATSSAGTSPAPAPSAITAAPAGSESSSPWVWWLVGLILLAAAVTAVVLWMRSRAARRRWDADFAAALTETRWLAVEIVPALQRAKVPAEREGAWAIARPRVTALETDFGALSTTAPDGQSAERAAALLASVRGTRATADQEIGVGGPTDEATFADLFDARRQLDDALALANPDSGGVSGPSTGHS